MSKIQEALRRLQSSQPPGSTSPKPGADVAKVSLATVDDRKSASSERLDFSTSNKVLRLDRDGLMRAGLIPPEEDSHVLATQFRQIKRPLIRHAFGKRATKVEDGNLIMITSALAGEGKTFTSINLALSMARERDHSVILVDADVAKPHVSSIFGISDEPGLLDIIEDSSLSVESLIMPTDVDGLSILPAGRPRPHATELLASSRMEEIAAALATVAHEPIILFDSPPLLQTSESSVVATLVGQIVVVVRADSTSHEALQMALKTLGQERAVSMVLNQARDGGNDFQYGYGYGYAATSEYPDGDREQV